MSVFFHSVSKIWWGDIITMRHSAEFTYSLCITPPQPPVDKQSWWHQMETFSALLAICAGNSPVTGEFPGQRPVTRSFDVFFDLRLNKRTRKHSWDWWFETPSCSLWRHCNDYLMSRHHKEWNAASPLCIQMTWLYTTDITNKPP